VADKCAGCLRGQELEMNLGRRQSFEDCGACVERHGVVPLDDNNLLAWALYRQLQGQVRAGLVVGGLDVAVLPVAFSLWEIPKGAERRELFSKLMALDAEFCEHRQREQERERRRHDARGRA